MFSALKRAWAVWMLSTQCFAANLNGPWGYDIRKSTTSKKIANKRQAFSEDYAIRLQQVQLECADALYIIRSRDSKDSFFYCDPPYFNSNCGHYKGYKEADFDSLLKCLSGIEGKFLLSSYNSDILQCFVKQHSWHSRGN